MLCLAIGEFMSTKKKWSGHLPHRKPLGFRETETENQNNIFRGNDAWLQTRKPFVPSMNAPIWEKHNYCEFVNQTRGNPLRVYTHHWTKPCVWWFFSLWKMALKIPVKLSGKTGSKMVQTYFNHKVPHCAVFLGQITSNLEQSVSPFRLVSRYSRHLHANMFLGSPPIFGSFDFVWFSTFCVCQTW